MLAPATSGGFNSGGHTHLGQAFQLYAPAAGEQQHSLCAAATRYPLTDWHTVAQPPAIVWQGLAR